MNDTRTSSSVRMQCMEIWGGNKSIDQHFEAPGLNICVASQPYRGSAVGGGDVYYLTSCASGRISRFLLADVSGHGAAASEFALELRDLLRKNVNRVSQRGFVTEMNQRFGQVNHDTGFATAAVATFFEPNQSLSVSVAGHPYPVYYRASRDGWVHLDPASREDNSPANLPFGIDEDVSYPGRTFQTEPGDMFLLYSDAYIEARNRDGNLLGVQGLVELLNQLENPKYVEVIPFLRDQLGSMDQRNLKDDDATAILGQFNSNPVRLKDNFMAPFRLFGKVTDRTTFE